MVVSVEAILLERLRSVGKSTIMESGKTSAMWSGGGRMVCAVGLEVTHQYCWLGCEGMRVHPLC